MNSQTALFRNTTYTLLEKMVDCYPCKKKMNETELRLYVVLFDASVHYPTKRARHLVEVLPCNRKITSLIGVCLAIFGSRLAACGRVSRAVVSLRQSISIVGRAFVKGLDCKDVLNGALCPD